MSWLFPAGVAQLPFNYVAECADYQYLSRWILTRDLLRIFCKPFRSQDCQHFLDHAGVTVFAASPRRFALGWYVHAPLGRKNFH